MAFSPASAPPENLLSNTGAAPRPFRLRPVPAKREKNRPVASAVGLFERASLFVESSQIILHVLRLLSPRVARRVVTGRFFRALTWAAAFSLCFVSLFWLAKKRNEASNAARSYRMNHSKMKLPRQRRMWVCIERGEKGSASLCPRRQLLAGQRDPASAPSDRERAAPLMPPRTGNAASAPQMNLSRRKGANKKRAPFQEHVFFIPL